MCRAFIRLPWVLMKAIYRDKIKSELLHTTRLVWIIFMHNMFLQASSCSPFNQAPLWTVNKGILWSYFNFILLILSIFHHQVMTNMFILHASLSQISFKSPCKQHSVYISSMCFLEALQARWKHFLLHNIFTKTIFLNLLKSALFTSARSLLADALQHSTKISTCSLKKFHSSTRDQKLPKVSLSSLFVTWATITLKQLYTVTELKKYRLYSTITFL